MIEDLIRSVLGMPPGARKINEDLQAMRSLTRTTVEQLIPWEEEKEMEILSLNHTLQSGKKGLDKIHYGTIQSIYYEPMVAFAYKDYVKGTREALLYCRTRQLEYVYRIKRAIIDVYFNGDHVAYIDHHNTMYGARSRRPIGMTKSYSKDLLSVFVYDKDKGHLFNPLRPHSEQQRAFYMLSDLSDEEENIFLALGLQELVMRILTNKKKK